MELQLRVAQQAFGRLRHGSFLSPIKSRRP
jgi:hypothetical protein